MLYFFKWHAYPSDSFFYLGFSYSSALTLYWVSISFNSIFIQILRGTFFRALCMLDNHMLYFYEIFFSRDLN